MRQVQRSPEGTQTMKILLTSLPSAREVSGVRMEWLLLQANLLYYMRSKKAVQDVWRVIKRHKLGVGTIFTILRDDFWGK